MSAYQWMFLLLFFYFLFLFWTTVVCDHMFISSGNVLITWSILSSSQCDNSENQHEVNNNTHVVGISDLIDLWVIKIKKPIILSTHSTLRSSEQSTKCRSRSKNMQRFVYSIVKITVFYDNILNMADTCLRNSRGLQRYVGFFSWLCFWGHGQCFPWNLRIIFWGKLTEFMSDLQISCKKNRIYCLIIFYIISDTLSKRMKM